MRTTAERQRRLGNQVRVAENFHRLAAVVGVLGIGAIFVVRWFVDPHDQAERFDVDHLPHPYATIAAAAILALGWVLMGRAGEVLRQAGIAPGDAADTTIRARPGAVVAMWQLYGTAILGVLLVALFGIANETPKPDDTKVWPVLATLALSEVMCVAWAWEGAALAEELAQLPALPPPIQPQVAPLPYPPGIGPPD